MEFQWFSTKWKYAILSQRLLTRPTSVLDSTCHLLLLGRLQVSHYRMFHFDCYLSVCHGMTQSAQTSLWTWFLSRRWNLKGHDISQKWTHPNQQAATDEYTRNHLSQDVCARPQEEKRKLSTVTARLLTQCQHYPVFLPSCCVSLIFIITSATPSVLNVKKRISRAHFLFQSAVAWVRHVICAAQFWTGFYWSWEGFFASARDAPWFVVIVVYTVSSDGVNISSDVPLYVILGAANFLARRIC